MALQAEEGALLMLIGDKSEDAGEQHYTVYDDTGIRCFPHLTENDEEEAFSAQ